MQSFCLEDNSELSDIKQYLKDEIKFMTSHINHHIKWVNKVYHPNVYKSLEFEKRSYEIILKRLLKK